MRALPVLVALAALACNPPFKAPAPKTATKDTRTNVSGGKVDSMADGARSGMIPGAQPGAGTNAVQAGGTVIETADGWDDTDANWNGTADMNGDGTPEMITIVYDEEKGLVYIVWHAPFEADFNADGYPDCSDAGAVNLVVVRPDSTYTAYLMAMCEGTPIMFGCDYAPDSTCTACGACVNDGMGGMQCEPGPCP